MVQSKARTPTECLASLPEPRKSELKQLHQLIRKAAPKLKPHIRSGMLGYGPHHYRYPSGREGDWSLIGLIREAAKMGPPTFD